MASNKFVKNGYIYDSTGARLMKLNSSENKKFAVITKCGHCGQDYFIPIMFETYCKDIESAIERVKLIPRVQRDNKDVILDAFEISHLEDIFISAINDIDPYLKGYFDKNSSELQDRRIMHKRKLDEILKTIPEDEDVRFYVRTADSYMDSMVLQRYFAPIIQGNKVIYPSKINRRQMLDEFFYQAALTKGVKKGNVAFMTMYYQLYGKNNPLGLVLDGFWFQYKDKNGKHYAFEIPDIYLQKMAKNGVFEGETKEEIIEEKPTNILSPLEKFNRRLKKTAEIQCKQKQPGEE